jgi:TRAP-type C4-dicarboxylate transport system substrate-binding protein
VTRAAFVRSLTIRGFGLLGGSLPVLSYAVLALVAGIESTIVAEARDFRAADIQVESFSTVQALHYMDQLITERTGGRHRIMVFHSGELGDEGQTLKQTRAGIISVPALVHLANRHQRP